MKLLRLKHWQLFIILFAIPFVAYLVGIVLFAVMMIKGGIAAENSGERFVPEVKNFIPLIIAGVIMFACAIIHYVWMYSAATKLQQFMHPAMRKLKVKRFKIFFFSPFVYMLLLSILLPTAFSQVNFDVGIVPPFLVVVFVFMFLGHLYSAFCMIYILYFCAKTVKSAALQREAHFSDYIGEFFLFWFFPIGVWFLQPKINKVVSRLNEEFESTEILER